MSAYLKATHMTTKALGGYQELDMFSSAYLGRDIRKEIREFTNVEITPEYASAPDLISFDKYGTTRLWWIICLYNGIVDPTFDIKSGVVLRIPSLEGIKSYLAKIRETEKREVSVIL